LIVTFCFVEVFQITPRTRPAEPAVDGSST